MSFLREPDAEPIPGYRLVEPLGSGGFGEVWKCEAPGGLFKAIKFVYGNLNSLDVDGARAEQELHALARIKEVRHPFVLSLDRIEVVEGELVIVMELADSSLHDYYVECQSAGLIGIPRDTLLRYIRDAAEALDHMNEKHGLQHLDIKPRNLFLVSDRVKVADFGLVKHLERQSGMLGGATPLYAPPETFAGKISERSDQYSLAIVYQEMLTGHRPFAGKNARVLAQQHMQEEPEVRALPEMERPVVARALSKDPAKRFPNCLAFLRALYTARTPPRAEPIVADSPSAIIKKGPRPKTMADTMEDIQLEQDPPLEDEWVDLFAPVGPRADGEGEGASKSDASISQLGITVAQPQTGALRPTLLVGVGSFGRRVLMELRCRFLDRFGDLSKIPLLRFLYIDSDQEAIKAALRGAPEVAFSPGEAYHLPLQPVGHYRRRQLDHLSDWLPREKLYAMPRSLQTQGSRALGRLAFADNYLRLMARLRREIQQAAHPDSLYQSVSQTGLALRDGVPRVCVIAPAGGGSSGFLPDLGYALRRLLQQLRYTDAQVTTFIHCGAPEDPATPRTEQANVYATLTEVNHFCDSAVPFTAQYGTDGPRLVDQGQPFDSVYLVTACHRTPEARRDTVAHLGSYLFHELTTPLGLRLDRQRQLPPNTGSADAPMSTATLFRSFGTYGVWFPRGLLLRLAARRACHRIIEEWQAAGTSTAQVEVEAACARVLADPGLRPEAVAARVEAAAEAFLEGAPAEMLMRLLTSLEEQSQQSVAHDDPGNWARQAVTRVREWLGAGLSPGHESGEWRKSRLGRALENAAQQVAEDWDKQLAGVAFGLMEPPGRRLAAAEEALQHFILYCNEAAEAYSGRFKQQAARTQQASEQLQAALENCLAGQGGFSFFGGRSQRLLRVFVDHLAAFARQCLAEDIAGSVQKYFASLHSRLNDRVRDLSFCRQRLRHLQHSLQEGTRAEDLIAREVEVSPSFVLGPSSFSSPAPSSESVWEAIQQSATTRVVLPEGDTDLEHSAQEFLETLAAEQWTELDQALQDHVLAPLGGLHHACLCTGDLVHRLSRPLLDQATTCLSDHLPVTDVAQVEFSAAVSQQQDVASQARTYFASAAPLVAGSAQDQQHAFLLIPASEAGKAYGEEALQAVPELELVRVPGQADLMFCREQSYLNAEDLQRILRNYRAAYEGAATVPSTSPHARCDITDWLPLDP